MLSKLGGRKFIFILVALATGTAIELLTERGITESYMMLLLGLASVFTAGNAVVNVRALGTKKEAAEEGAVEVADTSQVEARLEGLEKDFTQLRQDLADELQQSFQIIGDRLDKQDKMSGALTALLSDKNQ